MAFIPKDWRDAPDATTPLSAAALEDMETRLAAYALSVGSRVGEYAERSVDFVNNGGGTALDVDGLTVTVTEGRLPYTLSFRGWFLSSNTTGRRPLAIITDTTNNQLAVGGHDVTVANGGASVSCEHRVTNPTPGATKTFKVRCLLLFGAGASTVQAAPTGRAVLRADGPDIAAAKQWSSLGAGYHVASPTERQHYAEPIPFATDGTRRGLIVCHGRGVLAEAGIGGAPIWTGVGLPNVTPDMGSTIHWGNDASINRVTSAKGFLVAKGAKSDKALIVAISMGALSALSWARQNLSSVAAIALITPVVSLPDVHDNNLNGWAAEIESAYGGAAAYTAALPTHNPAQFAAQLAGIPIRAYYSTDDPTARATPVASFVAAVGSSAQAVPIGAFGHTTGTWDFAPAAAFLAANA